MYIKSIFLFFLMFLFGNIYSQNIDFDKYQPIKSNGELPLDFFQRTSHKVEDAINTQVQDSEKRTIRKSKKDFLLMSNYMIDDLLMSGNVLFGDPITEYVNKIADIILKDEPELRKELRFYCLKSNITNAFTTNQGMIFISLGLISQMENEAQLAFVIGHEINHFKEKHVINSAIESESIFSESNRTKDITQDQKIIKLSDYSKALELESDAVGFAYTQNAGYDVQEVLNSFDVLQFSHLPFDEIKVDLNELESESFKIPSQYKLETPIPVNFNVNEDDEKSSHPNLNKRRDQISKLLLDSKGFSNGKKYFLSKEKFLNIQKTCRFESLRISLRNFEFINSYYNSTVLLKDNPTSEYLERSRAKALYGIAKFKLDGRYGKMAYNYMEYEGSISSAYYFFENSDKDAVASIAVKQLFETNKKYPSKHLTIALKNLIKNVIKKNGGNDFNFDWYYPVQNLKIDTLNERQEDLAIQEESKYEKLKRIQDDQSVNKSAIVKTEENYHKFIFDNYPHRDELRQLYKSVKNELHNEITNDLRKNFRNHIGAEKIVFVDPMYYTIDEKKGMKFENSEDLKYDLYDQIALVGKAAEVETEVLSPKLCTTSDYEIMNHLSTCNDWIEEIQAISAISSKIDFIPSESEYMQEISANYNTKYYAFTGVFDYKRSKNALLFLPLLLFPPGWLGYPILMLYPSHETYYYTYIYNSETGKMNANEVYFIRRKPMAGNIQSYMYDIFTDMKKKSDEVEK